MTPEEFRNLPHPTGEEVEELARERVRMMLERDAQQRSMSIHYTPDIEAIRDFHASAYTSGALASADVWWSRYRKDVGYLLQHFDMLAAKLDAMGGFIKNPLAAMAAEIPETPGNIGEAPPDESTEGA